MTTQKTDNFKLIAQVEKGQTTNKIRLTEKDLIDGGSINKIVLNSFRQKENYIVFLCKSTYNMLKDKGMLRNP